MRRWLFTLTMAGFGDNIDEAWDDAVEDFMLDPGPVPDESEIDYEYEDDDD